MEDISSSLPSNWWHETWKPLSSSMSAGLSSLTQTKLLHPEYLTACCNNFGVVEPQQKIIHPQSIDELGGTRLADIITHHTTIHLRKSCVDLGTDSLFESFVNGTLCRILSIVKSLSWIFVRNEMSLRFCGRGNGIAYWVHSTIWAAPFVVTFGRLLLSSVTCNTFNSRDEHEVMTTIILRRGQRQSTNLAAFLSAPSFAHHHKRLFDRL